jgi:hypothetical protein
MAYAFFYDTPGDPGMYREVDALIGDQSAPGMLLHLAATVSGGTRHTFVWESEDDWNQFFTTRVLPAVTEILGRHNIPGPAPVQPQPIDLIDIWAPQSLRRLQPA